MALKQPRRARDRVPGKTAGRGYGHRHQQLRANLNRTVLMGGVRCTRCGNPIIPGEPWDLGHDDHNRAIYTGPEHRRCNRAAGGREGRRRQQGKAPKRLTSRNW